MRALQTLGICSFLFLATGVTGAELVKRNSVQQFQEAETRKLAEKAQKKVKVLGQVKKVGSIDWTKDMTLKKAIQQAGGLSRLANRRKVEVTRKGKTAKYDLSKEDPKILPGDTIEVPKRFF